MAVAAKELFGASGFSSNSSTRPSGAKRHDPEFFLHIHQLREFVYPITDALCCLFKSTTPVSFLRKDCPQPRSKTSHTTWFSKARQISPTAPNLVSLEMVPSSNSSISRLPVIVDGSCLSHWSIESKTGIHHYQIRSRSVNPKISQELNPRWS